MFFSFPDFCSPFFSDVFLTVFGRAFVGIVPGDHSCCDFQGWYMETLGHK